VLGPPPAWEPEVWIDEGPVRVAAQDAVARATPPAPARPARRASLPPDVKAELEATAGPRRAARLEERLDTARRAFERDRYQDARRLLVALADEAPAAASVRELLGLTYYRLERWKQAAAELEVFRQLTSSVDQHPVLMDCYRAQRRFGAVGELWAELRAVSPSPPVLVEGRIVMAGALADQGDLAGAISLLERADKTPAKVRAHHLRQWYVLGDLYDRAGDAPRARTLFRRVQAVDADFADVGRRLSTLGR